MIPFHRVAGLFYNRPLLLTLDAAQTISAYLLGRIEGRSASDEAAAETRISRFVGEQPVEPGTGRRKAFVVAPGGVGIISVVGELVNRGAWLGASSGLVSYEGLRHQLAAVGADSSIKSVVIDAQSPGGEALGAFDIAADVRKLAAIKPVYGLVNRMAASGGYALVSGATRIISAPDGMSGSIGVYRVHMDLSQQLAMEGVKPSIIYAGAHKIDGNPFAPLPADVREKFQRDVDRVYDSFVKTVAAGRKNLTEQQIRDTEARIFVGKDALDAGLVDEIGTFEQVIEELASGNGRAKTSGEKRMSDETRVAVEDVEEIEGEESAADILASDDEGESVEGDTESPSVAAEVPAAVAAAGADATAASEELARLRLENSTMKVDKIITDAVTALKFPPAQKAKDGESAPETLASLLHAEMLDATLSGRTSSFDRMTKMIALMPSAPGGKLPSVKPLEEAVTVGTETTVVQQRLATRGITPKTRGYSQAFEKELSVYRAEKAN